MRNKGCGSRIERMRLASRMALHTTETIFSICPRQSRLRRRSQAPEFRATRYHHRHFQRQQYHRRSTMFNLRLSMCAAASRESCRFPSRSNQHRAGCPSLFQPRFRQYMRCQRRRRYNATFCRQRRQRTCLVPQRITTSLQWLDHPLPSVDSRRRRH